MAVSQNLRANRSWTDVLLAWLVEPETVTREELLEFSDATWDVIFQCATQHRILPLMAWQVNKLPQVAIPEQRIQALHTASRGYDSSLSRESVS
jgi:Mg2+/Co2+ transporter CorC